MIESKICDDNESFSLLKFLKSSQNFVFKLLWRELKYLDNEIPNDLSGG